MAAGAVKLSVLDITDGSFFETTLTDPSGAYTPDSFGFHSEKYQTFATTPDLFSAMVTTSTV